jgi:hypothetical protein
MRLEITIDGYYHGIDSTDPELLGKWMVEIFARASVGGCINNNTYIQVRAQPSWVPDFTVPGGGRADWIVDSRIIGETWQVKSPREVVEKLMEQVEAYEKKG